MRDFNPAREDTLEEMKRQDLKWGPQTHPDGTGKRGDMVEAFAAKRRTDEAARDGSVTWRDILEEEVFEAYAETDPEKLYAELIQVAGVATQWANDVRARAKIN